LPKPLPNIESVHTIIFDFDGVFTDNKVFVDQNGNETVRCDRGDGLAFDFVRAFQRRGHLQAELFILSKEMNPVVLARAKKLKLECRHGIKNKKAYVEDYLQNRFPEAKNPMSGVIYLGNDLNDLPVMRDVGFSVAPMDAHPRVQETADLVLNFCGGAGFVRNFIEQLLGINTLTDEALDELISDC